MSGEQRDVEKYPHVLDKSSNQWHRRREDDETDGPAYPVRCGAVVTTSTVDVPEGPTVDEWESKCGECYR